MSQTWGPNWPPLVQKTLFNGQGDPIDLHWCKKCYITDRGVQPTTLGTKNITSRIGGSNRPFRCLESAIHNMDHISHLQLLRIFKTDNARETKPAFPYLTDCLQSTEHICDLYICQLKLLEPKETKCLLQLPRPVHIIRKLSVCSLETNSNALFFLKLHSFDKLSS